MLLGAVARTYNPGAKFDLVLVLVGNSQGTGKSTFISKLGRQWFSDSFHTVTGQKAFEQLQGAWLIEMAELSGIRKSEVEPVKHFITKREDTYRPAYGKVIETYKRRCVFFATTNEREFLRDSSGNRRFMPVDVREDEISKSPLDDKSLTPAEVDQIWAEAVLMYKDGAKLYLSQEAENIARREQHGHLQTDDRQGMIEKYLDTKLPDLWDDLNIAQRRTFLEDPLSEIGTEWRDNVCAAEIWCECLGKSKQDMNRYNTREINDIMRVVEGWEHVNSVRSFGQYGRQKYYRRKID